MGATFVNITAHLQGETVIDRTFQALEDRIGDASPAWPAVIAVFKQIVGKAFASEGASTGQAWKPLAKSTQSDRKSAGFPPAHPILERTGELRRAVMLESGDNAVVDTANYLGISILLPYFKYHQSNKPRKHLPRRAPVLLTADDRHALVRPLRLYFTGHDPNKPVRGAK